MEYGAIDLHTKESEIRIIDGAGVVVFERRIATTRTRLTDVFGPRAPLRILLESGTGSGWVAQHLEDLGHEVVVADPNYAPMYGQPPAPDQDRSPRRRRAGRGESARGVSRGPSRVGGATRCPSAAACARSVGARAAASDQSAARAAAQRRCARADGRGRNICGTVHRVGGVGRGARRDGAVAGAARRGRATDRTGRAVDARRGPGGSGGAPTDDRAGRGAGGGAGVSGDGRRRRPLCDTWRRHRVSRSGAAGGSAPASANGKAPLRKPDRVGCACCSFKVRGTSGGRRPAGRPCTRGRVDWASAVDGASRSSRSHDGSHAFCGRCGATDGTLSPRA